MRFESELGRPTGDILSSERSGAAIMMGDIEPDGASVALEAT